MRRTHEERPAFRQGFVAMTPLWLGVVPFGLAYAVSARDAGLSLVETQALSLVLFAGSAQFSTVGLTAAGASALSIVATTFMLNVRHLLYGVSLTRRMTLTPRQVPVAAFFLTDEAFGVASTRSATSYRFLLGTELSLYLVWNLATLAGALIASEIPDAERLGVDVVFPLAFLAILVPLVRTRAEVVVAVVAGALAWVLAHVLNFGIAILVAGSAAALLGAWLTRDSEPPTAVDLDDAAREVA